MVELTSSPPPPRARPRAFVLLDPRGAFASVRARPTWLVALLVVLAFAVAPPIAFLARVDAEAFVERQLRRSGAMEKMPEAQRPQAISLGAKAMKLALPPAAVGKRAIWILFVTTLAFALLRTKKPEMTFKPVFAAAVVAAAPLVVKDVLEAGAFLAQNPLELDAQNAVLSNPAAWLGLNSQTSVAGALLKGLDFFELWSCVLVGIGANVVAETRSWLPYVASFGLQVIATMMAAVGAAFA